MKKKYFKYWGKINGNSYHPLVYHSLDVASVGRIIFETSPLLHNIATELNVKDTILLNWITFLCALHDIGKFSDGFQGLNPISSQLQNRDINANYREKHWSIGYRFLIENKGCICFEKNSDFLKYWFSASIGHHGRPPKIEIIPQPIFLQFPQDVKKDVFEFILELKELFNINDITKIGDYNRESETKHISWIIAGLVTISDWIASNKNWFPFCTEKMSLQEYYNQSNTRASKSFTESGIRRIPVAKNKSFNHLFPFISHRTSLQDISIKIDIPKQPQLLIIEDITGNGKTESALMLAYRLMAKGFADGLYFALPTMATANAMHKRIGNVYTELYEKESAPLLVLAHSASKTQIALEFEYSEKRKDDSRKDTIHWISENRKKALFAHIGVGTIDQALLAILQAHHQSLRLLALSRKVLIVDEVHASDGYIHTLLRNLLKFHAAQGGSVILLSATLPLKMREELIKSFAEGLDKQLDKETSLSLNYPLITQYTGDKFIQESCISPTIQKQVYFEQYFDEDNVFNAIEKKLQNGACVCWVRNTIFDVLAAYRKAQKKYNFLTQEDIILFHSRFIMGDRLKIEKKIMDLFGPHSNQEKRKGKLVIATQVIEQSLDIDFDFMVSDLAPIDLIIQRAGRLHRHKRERKNKQTIMGVFMPNYNEKPQENWYKDKFPKAAKVYIHHGKLWLTAKWIVKHKCFSMPEDARYMIESVYSEDANKDIPDVFEIIENQACGSDAAFISSAHFNQLNIDDGYIADGITWEQDDNAPTRLGEPTRMLRLVKKTGTNLEPFYQNTDEHWELSQVSVYASMISKECAKDKTDIESIKARMPDEGKYCLVAIMSQQDIIWKGRAINEKDNEIELLYDSKIGLRISQGGIDEFDK